MLKNRLLLLVLGTVLIPLLVAAVVSSWITGMLLEESLRERLRRTSQAILLDLGEQQARLASSAREVGLDPGLLAAVRSGDRQALLDRLTSMMLLTGVGHATIVDAEGRILVEGHNPGQYGELVSTESLRALQTVPSSGLAVTTTALELEALIPLREGDRLLGLLDLGRPLDHAMLAATREKYGVELSVLRGSRLQSTTMRDPSVLLLAVEGGAEELDGGGELGIRRVLVDGVPHSMLDVPLRSEDGTRLATLQVAMSHREINRLQKTLTLVLAGLTATVILTVTVLAQSTSRTIVKPLGSLADHANRIAEGSFTPQVPVEGPGEIGELARAFDHMAEELHASTTFLEAVIENAADGVCVCHDVPEFPFVKFTVWNQRMIEITGYSMNEINTLGWYQTVYPDPEVQNRARERMERMREGAHLYFEPWEITSSEGQKRSIAISTSTLTSSDSKVHVLALMHDLTEEERLRTEARYARIDYLTGVRNRRGFFEQAKLLFDIAARQAQTLTLAYLDVDKLKTINDELGHLEGDELLKSVGRTLLGAIRTSDLVGRIGGDEFAIALLAMSSADAKAFFGRLRDDLLLAFRDRGWESSVSMGVVTFSGSIPAIEDMISFADRLMYRAKVGGRGGIRYEEYEEYG